VLVVASNGCDYTDGALTGRDLPFTRVLARALGDGPAQGWAPVEGAVVEQLTRGATDETAARQLGLGLRTYQRVVAKIMSRLGARSRFQAGYRMALSIEPPRPWPAGPSAARRSR
jgi:hypothetical protein